MRFRRETAECASAQAKHRDLPCRHVLALRRSARSEHGKEHVGLGGSSRENGKSVLDLPFSEWIHSQVRHAPKDGVQLTVAADVFMDNSGNFPEGSSDWADSVHWRREEKRREDRPISFEGLMESPEGKTSKEWKAGQPRWLTRSRKVGSFSREFSPTDMRILHGIIRVLFTWGRGRPDRARAG
jgi:hypothetical protein